MALQFVRAAGRFKIDLEIEHGQPGASAAFDHVAISTTASGKTKRKRYKSLDLATRDYHQAIAAQLDDGFSLEVDNVGVVAPEPARFTPFPELERVVDDEPDNVDHWFALAAAWRGADDPRGECIHFESKLAGLKDPGEFVRRKAQVEAWRRIRNAHVWGVLGRDAYRLRATFRHGLVECFVLADELGAPGRSTCELLSAALVSPFIRFLREVRVGDKNADGIADVLAASAQGSRAKLVVV